MFLRPVSTPQEREVEVKPAVSKEEMRRHDGGRGSRSYSGGSGGSYGYSSSRDMPPSRGPSMYDGMSSGGACNHVTV